MFKRNVLVFSLIAISLVVLTILTGCSDSGDTEQTPQSTGNVASGGQSSSETEVDPRADWPEKLVYALVPTEDQDTMVRRNEPIAAYLEERLGVEVEVFSGTDYTANVEAMRNGHAHIAYLGPFAYILAHERAGAEAFAFHLSSPEAKPTYQSLFIALEGNGIETIEDLADKTFGWADPASTSGYLFPRAHLINEIGLADDDVDSWFSDITFTGGHESSVLSVLNGDIQAAAISSGSGLRALEAHSDHPNADKIKIIGNTRDIPSSAYSYQKDLPEDLKAAIVEAFLDIPNQPALEDFIEEMGIHGGYIPNDDSNYDIIRDTASALNISPEDLMK